MKLTPQDITEHLDKFCSGDDIAHWVLAMRQNEVIGRVAVFKREINMNKKKVVLGGIGKLKVRDDWRRQGVATKLIDQAMPLFEKIGCDLVYLCTNIQNPIMTKFYEKYGFRYFEPGCEYCGKSGKKYHETGAMFAAVNTSLYEWLMNHTKPISIGCGNW